MKLVIHLLFCCCFGTAAAFQQTGDIVTVGGIIPGERLGKTLVHEHILTNFNGTEVPVETLASPQQVIDSVLPWLLNLRRMGYSSLVECTPSFIGKNIDLLHRLSQLSGLNIITNTGYYAAVDKKYLPNAVDILEAEELAAIWEEDWSEGIGTSGIRPGFIKLGVGSGPLDNTEEKIITAGFLLSDRTGLPVYVHTGGDQSIISQYRLGMKMGFDLNSLVWAHAQNGSDSTRIAMAKNGIWISLDGVNEKDLDEYIRMIGTLREAGHLGRLLISHDDGWSLDRKGPQIRLSRFANGNLEPYTTIGKMLIPALRKLGYSVLEIHQLVVENPSKALAIRPPGH